MGVGGLKLLPNFQKGGGLGRTSILRGGLLGRWVIFFRGEGLQFLDEKLKSGIFNDKKVHKQECFALS